MSLFKTPKVNPPATQPAPPTQGADVLKVGADDPTNLRKKGAVGRLALRVGKSTTPTA